MIPRPTALPLSFVLLLASSAPAQTTGYWRFEEGAADAAATATNGVTDSSPTADHGTPSGGPVYRTSVPFGTVPATGAADALSLEFDGLDDEVAMAGTFPFHQPGDASVEFMLFHVPSGHRSVLWTRANDADTNRFNFFVNANSTFGFDYRDPAGLLHPLVGLVGTGIPIPAHTWTHIAVTRQGDVYRLYVNGTLDTTATDTSPNLPTSVGWQVAGRSGLLFAGKLDELRLTTGALVPGQFLVESFQDLGFALAGTNGAPTLGGTGILSAGEPITVTLGNALPNATTFLAVGALPLLQPFSGGTFVPVPQVVATLDSGPNGAFVIATPWPAAVPSGFSLYVQAWVVDPGGPQGYAASNGILAVAP